MSVKKIRSIPRPLHEISDSDSEDDSSILSSSRPSNTNLGHKRSLKGDGDCIKGKSREQQSKEKHSASQPTSFHELSHSDDSDMIPDTPQKARKPELNQKTSLHDISDSDTTEDEGSHVPRLEDMVSPVKAGSLGKKLNKDPSLVSKWAGMPSTTSTTDAGEAGPSGGKRSAPRKEKDQGRTNSPAKKKPRLGSGGGSTQLGRPKGHGGKKTSADIVAESRPFCFLLTKAIGIPAKFNESYAINLREILCPSMGDLQKSAQFSYVFDIPWLVQQYPPEFRKCPLTLVHGFQRQDKKAFEAEAKPFPHITLCRGKLEIMYGTHHTKMMFLVYAEGLRVVITTANLIEKDWSQKTQGLWVSPVFPHLGKESATDGDSPTHFKRDLLQYVSVYGDPEMQPWVTVIKSHDMSAVRVHLIASVPGRHTGDKKSAFGHLKLRKVLTQQGPEESKVSSWPALAQFSSVGSLGPTPENWLCGEFLASLAACRGAQCSNKPKLQLMYPSKENVRLSLEGYPAGASLPYSINTAKKQTYLHTFWNHWYSRVRGRSAACPHIKTYLRASPDWRNLAWFIVTSANMSKAAWGALEKAGSQLMIRSYEIGVLFLPEQFGCDKFEALSADHPPTGKAEHVFHVPYDLPPTHYEKRDRPWVWDIPYIDKPDTHGNKWCPT